MSASTNGYKIALLSGDWVYGLNRGAFCWSVANAPSNRYRYFGGRLVYVPIS